MNKIIAVLLFCFLSQVEAQQLSTARIWNEMVLNAIRNDYARPTVHARNLFHTSIAMYDAYAAYDDTNETYFLGKTLGDYTCLFEGVSPVLDIQAAREEAISYAVFRLILHRFNDAPGRDNIFHNIDLIFSAFGFDKSYTSTDYTNGNPAALGNYIAASLIEFGLQDGSNEANDYENQYYESINPELNPFLQWSGLANGDGNPRLVDPNRWQKLSISNFVGQAGNELAEVPDFIGPEWGNVLPFAMNESNLSIQNRDGNDYWVYHDPGPPAMIDFLDGGGSTEDFVWGFSMTAHWKSHTVRDTNYLWDISPRSIGNSELLPTSTSDIRSYYDFIDGGDKSPGHALNPYTEEPYSEQWVPRSDYTTVIAEFWADGPQSETPPGHWFTILNYVSDQEELVKKYKGEGPVLSDLEWDVRSYFVLGGAMHDAAIAAWSSKGYYDYIRPISAIRYLVDQGQSSDPDLPNYSPNGILLVPNSIELIDIDDPLLNFDQSNLNRIKIKGFIREADTLFTSGDLWLPYQSPNFVTPPFAGYVSGHSTFSRAAAEVLSSFTGDPFFPGGLGEYHIESGDFLEFGLPGPTMDMSLQWATYVDAANQSALSRIWGGIHPPIDDIPGRIIGVQVANQAFLLADELFGQPYSSVSDAPSVHNRVHVYPNPVSRKGNITIELGAVPGHALLELTDGQGRRVLELDLSSPNNRSHITLSPADHNLKPNMYVVSVKSPTGKVLSTNKLLIVD